MIILASTSPRRKELIDKITKYYIAVSPEIDEEKFSYFKNEDISRNLAKLKAYSVFNSFNNECILGCDTVVIFDHKLLGKPKDKTDAIRMLHLLNGKKHIVLTSYCILYKDYEITKSIKTEVFFNDLSEKDIQKYIVSNMWIGKAGAYGIQDKEFNLVKKIEGSYYNVVGLPIEEITKDLKKLKLIK